MSGVYRGRPGGEESSPGIPSTNLSQDVRNTILSDPDTGKKTIDQDLVSYYLEQEATSPSTLKPQIQKPFGMMCGSSAMVGEDEDGNAIAIRISCRREWCSDCRDIEHDKRRARSLRRLMQILPMAYDVITFPLEVRLIMRNPKVLTLLAKKVRRLYRRSGYRKVYTRWHFFGSKSNVYNPHLNVLYDGRWLSPQELADFKDLIRCKLLRRSIAKEIKKDLVIHHQYFRSSKKAMHRINYVTKATFLEREWDEPLAEALYGFHNACFAGHWNDPPKWHLTHKDKKLAVLAKLQEGLHPISGKPITWTRKPIPWVLVLMRDPVHLGGWWYLLRTIRAPPWYPLTPQLKAS